MEPEDSSLITQADIDRLKARDERWRQIDLAIAIDDELNKCFGLNLILDVMSRQSADAMSELMDIDPSNTSRISYLQSMIKYAKIISYELNALRQRANAAQESLEEEGKVNFKEGSEHGEE